MPLSSQLTAEAHGNTKARATKSRARRPPPPANFNKDHSNPLERRAHGARGLLSGRLPMGWRTLNPPCPPRPRCWSQPSLEKWIEDNSMPPRSGVGGEHLESGGVVAATGLEMGRWVGDRWGRFIGRRYPPPPSALPDSPPWFYKARGTRLCAGSIS